MINSNFLEPLTNFWVQQQPQCSDVAKRLDVSKYVHIEMQNRF
jgi:hypothetical protein